MRKVFLILLTLFFISMLDYQYAFANEVTDMQCVSADKIVKKIVEWRILATKLTKKNKKLVLEVTAHNPVNKKNINAIDVTFIFNVNYSSGVSTSTYDLTKAIFINENNTVTFEKVYKLEKVKDGTSTYTIRIPTPCFQRNVVSKN